MKTTISLKTSARDVMRRSRAFLVSSSSLLFILATPGNASEGTGSHAWTAYDSVCTRYIIDAEDHGYLGDIPARPIVASKDGSRFLFVERRGNVETDENAFVMRVYETDAVRNAIERGDHPTPIAECLLRSSGNLGAISNPRWSDDNKSIIFRGPGKNGDAEMGYYSFEVGSSKIAQIGAVSMEDLQRAFLTGAFVGFVDIKNDAGIYVRYNAPWEWQPAPTDTAYPMETITSDVASKFVFGYKEIAASKGASHEDKESHLSVYIAERGVERKLFDLPADAGSEHPYGLTFGRIAPDGKHAVLSVARDMDQQRWRDFDQETNQRPAQEKPRLRRSEASFMLVDLTSGSLISLLDAPVCSPNYTYKPDVLWAETGDAVVLIDTKLPASSGVGSRLGHVVYYNLRTRKYHVITPVKRGDLTLVGVRWAIDGKSLVSEWNSASSRRTSEIVFATDGKRWSETRIDEKESAAWLQAESQEALMSPQAEEFSRKTGKRYGTDASFLEYPPPQLFRFRNGMTIGLEEGPNSPQHLVARWAGQEVELLGVDSYLQNVAMAPTTVFEWKASDGLKHRGLLTMPANPKTTPVPLVVQWYKFMPNVFRPDGFTSSGNARQALAARGMAVLEMSIHDGPAAVPANWEKEVPPTLDVLEAAIEQLAKERPINTNRIGVLGFSRSGYLARQSLVHTTRYKIAAAIGNDSYTNSYLSYMFSYDYFKDLWHRGGENGPLNVYMPAVGDTGGHFPQEKWEEWLDRSDGISASRSSGAMLDIVHSRDDYVVTQLLGYYGIGFGFRSAGRPYEYVRIARSIHVLQTPAQRFASISLNVDWMDFWLNDHERIEPCAAAGETEEMLTAQYTRWRKMKVDWERQQAWEAAGHPAGSIPDKDFKAPEKKPEEKKPEPVGSKN